MRLRELGKTARLEKSASALAWLKAGGQLINGTISGVADLIGTATRVGAVTLVAASALGGIGVGALAAKSLSHDNKDIETARKNYESERLDTDIGYLASRLREERDLKNYGGKPVKSARILE